MFDVALFLLTTPLLYPMLVKKSLEDFSRNFFVPPFQVFVMSAAFFVRYHSVLSVAAAE